MSGCEAPGQKNQTHPPGGSGPRETCGGCWRWYNPPQLSRLHTSTLIGIGYRQFGEYKNMELLCGLFSIANAQLT